MVEKVSVNPGRVRCWGNIVSPKTSTDFNVYSSGLSTSTDTVNGETKTVYTSEYLVGSKLIIDFYEGNLVDADSEYIGVQATLRDNTNEFIVGATLKCVVNDNTVLTGVTDSDGYVDFEVPIVEESKYVIRISYEGTDSIAGCFRTVTAYVGSATGLNLTCTDSFVESTGVVSLVATLTGTIGSEENIPIPYQTVSFYEEYTPTSLKVTGNPNPVVNGEDTVITAVLKDSDGSGIKGETVSIYFKG